MATSREDAIFLSIDCYKTYDRNEWEEGVTTPSGSHYRILEQVNGPNGYQGTLYQNKITNDLVPAHRGTEFDRELFKDAVIADGGMVLTGYNPQADAASALTQKALDYAAKEQEKGTCVTITNVGHSLGGTDAQISSHRLNVPGVTINAYGAAGLAYDIPEGGSLVQNHVRATDFVSSASRHFGEVHIYAAEKDIQILQNSGYENNDRFVFDMRNPFGAALSKGGIQAHYKANFEDNNDVIGQNILSEENRSRYQRFQPMVDKFRQDISLIHSAIALPRNVVDGVIDTGDAVIDAARARLRGESPSGPSLRSGSEPGRCPVPSDEADTRKPGRPPTHHDFERDPLSYINQMLKASDQGDNETFRNMTRTLAESPRAKAMETEAIAAVDRMEQQASLQQQNEQQRQSEQMQAPVHRMRM